MAAAVLVLMVALQRAATPAPATVTGQLQMPDGMPAAAVRVAAIPAPPPNIRPTDGQNYYASQFPVSVALSDAGGAYRLVNLPAGRYYIVAGAVGHATYFPGTTDIEAATVVNVDAESRDLRADFRLLRLPGTRVRGRVTPPPDVGRERAVLSGTLLGELLEAPVREDGTFEFGRVPRGSYLLSLYPPPSGMLSRPFQVSDEDVVSIDLVRPPTRTVSGRIVSERGPLPRSLLGFRTELGYVPAIVNPDGTFTASLHAARHQVEVGGLPVGYAAASVRAGAEELTDATVAVADRDVTNLVITVAVPSHLPRLRGRIDGFDATRSSARVVLTGPIVGTVEAAVQADGSFEFPALPPGLYRVTVPQIPEIAAREVVVDSEGADIRLSR